MNPTLTSRSTREIRVAAALGHGMDVRQALARLEGRLQRGPVTVLGPLAPDAALCEMFRRRGALEGSAADTSAPTRCVVVPLDGLPKACRQRWKASGYDILDLTLPAVRRTQSSLALLAMEHCKPLVLGFRDDAESAAIAGEAAATAIIEDADEAALLPFAPKFGLVCQTLLSRRRAKVMADALGQRHRDSRMVFLDTTTPANHERERSVEALSRWAEAMIIVGEAGEASVRTLIEASRRLGLPVHAIADAAELDQLDFRDATRIGLSAGEFSPDCVIETIANRLRADSRG